MAITNTTLTTAAANIYASTGNSVVVTAFFCNTDSSAVQFNLYAVPSAGSAATSTQILQNVVVNAGDTYIMNTERLVLSNNETLKANANVNSVLISTVSYTGV
jgi:hypothetical protein